ncbi:MAG TPA: UTRA domain-containing protein [Streptosporangiaceae bacterium]|nr:UTRA domain-containing protein [Streptosporangiaceae bacterium]
MASEPVLPRRTETPGTLARPAETPDQIPAQADSAGQIPAQPDSAGQIPAQAGQVPAQPDGTGEMPQHDDSPGQGPGSEPRPVPRPQAPGQAFQAAAPQAPVPQQGGRAGSLWHPRLPGRKPPKIIRAPGVTAHGQIEDWLADEIAAGRLAPGDRLPTEQDLAAWLGVSRMTLRHALAELAQRGLVTRTVGRSGGTFVAAPKLEQDFTVLAGFSEQLRRHGLVAGARVLAAVQIPASAAASAALDISQGDPVYEVRRLRLADGQPILLEHSLFPAQRCPGLLDYRLDGSLYELLEEKYGQRPHRARESMEPVTAGVREAEALQIAEGAPLMLVERTAYARSGVPLEYARDLFRGDRTRVVVWTSELAGEL